nr:ATP-binding protein [Stenotrophomonas indicatrix]
MYRLLPQQPAIDAPSVAATVLLRWLSLCALLCLLGTAAFYVLAQLGDDVSMHRRDMNAAAYRAQLYVDQREALLNYLVDSVVESPAQLGPHNASQRKPDPSVQRLELGTSHDGHQLTLLLPARAEQTLAQFGVKLMYVGSAPAVARAAVPSQQTNEAPLATELSAAQLRVHTAQASHPVAVHWLPPARPGAPIYLYRAVEDGPNPAHWLTLSLDSQSVAQMLDGKGIGDFALLDARGQTVLAKGQGQVPTRWLLSHRQDTFGWIWRGAVPQSLALLKGIGQDGWRLVYHLPLGLLMRDIALHLGVSLVMCVGAIVALRALTRRIDRQLIQPALRQHRQLRESFDFGSTVIEMAPVGVCVLRGHDGMVMLENQLARDWLGSDSAAGDWMGNWRQGVSTAASGRRTVDYTTGDGRQLQALGTRTRYHDEDVVLCVFNDVSHHRQIQAALSAAKHSADQASQAKSAFLATMSHEIRTPLYGLLGTLELLGHTHLDPRQTQYLGTMQQSSSALLQLISDILDVSKIESGQLTLAAAEFSPLDLAEATLRAYAAAAARKQLQIMVCTDPQLPEQVLGDAGRIRQILGNLLSNAIKFTDNGHIYLRVRQLAREGNTVSISWQVTDTGIGIAAPEHARVFEPFRQVGTHSQLEGTGLGLSISDRLVRLMNGEIRLVSEPGLGSSFSMVLPLTLVKQADTDARVPLLPHPPIYVRCAIPELADSGAQWLRRWGATVRHYTPDAPQPGEQDAILLDSAPRDAVPIYWPGPRVTALADSGDLPVADLEYPDRLTVTVFSIRAIANALAQLQQGHRPGQLAPPLPRASVALRVLVAEDNPINRVILKEQLESLGCSVVTAADGQQALELSLAQSFDVVLTDISMPRLDGHALIRCMREQGIGVPVIGATANATPDERARCRASGMVGYIVKPIDIGTLHHTLSGIPQGVPA